MNREQKKIYEGLLKNPGNAYIDLKSNKLYALVDGGMIIFDGDEMNADFNKMNSDEVNKFIVDRLTS